MTTQRLSLAVSDPGAVAAELAGGLFVPTRLTFTLGEVVDLSLRLPHLSRPLDVPAVVVGRRLARPGGALSAGVVVRAADRHHPVLEILLDIVDGTIVDLETHLQQRLRLPARVTFATADDARAELACLLDPHGATLSLDAPAVRGDRLALAVVVNGAVVLTVPSLVRRLQLQEQTTSCVVVALDDEARDLLVRFLRASDVVGRQA